MQKQADHNGSLAQEFDKEQLKKRLTPVQYRVTQDKITERPFSGEYLKLNDNGMYACVVCGEELFSSECKFDSGCGWPAFNDVTDGKKVKLTQDTSHVGKNLLLLALRPDLARTEVSCANCNAHLGHLFDDGPKSTGKRYCINSSALQFFKTNGNSKSSIKEYESKPNQPKLINNNSCSKDAVQKGFQESKTKTNKNNKFHEKKRPLLETHL